MKQTLTNRIFSGGSFILCAMVLQKLSTAVFLVILGRQMPAENFGLLMLGATATNLFSLLSLFGLPSAASKFLSGRDQKEMLESYSSLVFLGAIYALGFSLLVLPWRAELAGILSDTVAFKKVLLIAVLGIPVQAVFRLFVSVLQARERNKELFYLAIVDGIVKILLPVIGFLLFDESVTAAMGGVIAAYFVSATVAMVFVTRHGCRWVKPQLDKVKQLGKFALPTMVVGFSYVLASQADRLMVGAFRSDAEVGFYAAAAVFAMVLSMLHTAFSTIFMPVASDLYHKGNAEDLNNVYSAASRWASISSGIGVIIFGAFGHQLLGIFGKDFQTPATHLTLIILAFFYFVSALFGPTSPVLQMGGSHKHEGVNAFLFLAANLTLNLLLIPRIGMVGAAVATLISGLIRNLIQAHQLKRKHNLMAIRKDQILILFTVLIAVFLQLFVPEIHPAIIGVVAASLLIYNLISALSEEEKHIANSLGLRFQTTFQNR